MIIFPIYPKGCVSFLIKQTGKSHQNNQEKHLNKCNRLKLLEDISNLY